MKTKTITLSVNDWDTIECMLDRHIKSLGEHAVELRDLCVRASDKLHYAVGVADTTDAPGKPAWSRNTQFDLMSACGYHCVPMSVALELQDIQDAIARGASFDGFCEILNNNF